MAAQQQTPGQSGGGSGSMPMAASASSNAEGAINIVNSDGSLNATGAFILSLLGVAAFLGFVLVLYLLESLRRP